MARIGDGFKDLPCRLRIGRYDGGKTGGGFSVRLEDVKSRMILAEVDLPLSTAADLFSGREVEGTLEYLTKSDKVGKQMENKEVAVEDLSHGKIENYTEEGNRLRMEDIRRRAVDKATRAWGEGWEADQEGYNHHRAGVGEGGVRLYRVTVRRWV